MEEPGVDCWKRTADKISRTDYPVELGDSESSLPCPQLVENDVAFLDHEVFGEVSAKAIEIVVSAVAWDNPLIEKDGQRSCVGLPSFLRSFHYSAKRLNIPTARGAQIERQGSRHPATSPNNCWNSASRL